MCVWNSSVIAINKITCGSHFWIELEFGVLVFVEGGKPENPEKNPRSRDKNQQQTQLTCDVGSRNQSWATVVGGERSHHCTIPASPKVINNIIGRGWAKYRDLSVASGSIICRSRRLRQIIDLRDTGKSWYFVVTEFNNCFIIRSPRLFSYFNHSLTAQGCDLPFFSWDVVPITHEQNIICSKTRLDGTTHEQTIICRQLFAGHVVESRPIERKENNALNDNITSLYINIVVRLPAYKIIIVVV